MTLRKKIFLGLLVTIQLALIWPIYALFGDVHLMVLGLPLSLAWIIAMLFASFFLLLWYYWTDPSRTSSPRPPKSKRP
ncbi:hypothetical protein [Fodinibius sediminis]|uniref:Uncharacterized protein n=1 Tax=Fodinibius sediminis TaxID=1214077 RepID=A0A521B0M7_9BACT|nr:hypothetical protein [Fodinibius sediminis]SMO40654.1 hypothetical protein SAMN06265218_10261 [Fodinibius sediminis]